MFSEFYFLEGETHLRFGRKFKGLFEAESSTCGSEMSQSDPDFGYFQ